MPNTTEGVINPETQATFCTGRKTKTNTTH